MNTKKYDVLIVGAGCAGLYCAYELLKRNLKVLVLEARPRIGGRAYTVHEEKWNFPVELGAEFLHGVPPISLKLMQAYQQGFYDIPDHHLNLQNGKLKPFDSFFPQIEKVMKKIPANGKDQSVRDFLKSKKLPGSVSKLFPAFVEGFHAADLDKISMLGLKATEQSSESELNGSAQFRPLKGYQSLVDEVHKSCLLMDPDYLRMNSALTAIQWKKSSVQLTCQNSQKFTAPKVVITVPLGVLKSKRPESQIHWDPMPATLPALLESVEMGHVQRITFQFNERFWENLDSQNPISFFHAGPEKYFPTWWTSSPARVPFLVAWQGGPKALEISSWTETERNTKALETLSILTKRSKKFLQDQLIRTWCHDWSQDLFSQGAYSYVLKDGFKTAKKFSQSIDDTIYFAGEATCSDSYRGTIEGAFISAHRAAEKIKGAL